MTDATRVQCLSCSREILAATANRTGGYCKPCKRKSELSEPDLFERRLFEKIDGIIEPFTDYPDALKRLGKHPLGFRYCFAFHYVNAEIQNGGISQLYRNSTWCLMPDAIAAVEAVGSIELQKLLVEIVFYYHRQNNSRLKRRIDEKIFDSIEENWDKTLRQLDDEFFGLETIAENVIPRLCSEHQQLFVTHNAL